MDPMSPLQWQRVNRCLSAAFGVPTPEFGDQTVSECAEWSLWRTVPDHGLPSHLSGPFPTGTQIGVELVADGTRGSITVWVPNGGRRFMVRFNGEGEEAFIAMPSFNGVVAEVAQLEVVTGAAMRLAELCLEQARGTLGTVEDHDEAFEAMAEGL